MEDLTGQVIKGYELRQLLGKGGFGAVYRAYQPSVGREVALKAILPAYVNHPEFIRRFEVEAQLVARLEHLHIVPLYDYWREPSGAYLVMRYLRGGNLRALLTGNPLDPEHAARLFDQIASALSLAHRYGIIHRDMKPDNVLLDEDGNSYLADFGIAKDLHSDTNVTQSDELVGSPAYFSPELIKGDAVTTRSDIYSLGIILYEMLTGQHPFPRVSPTTLMLKHINEPLPELELTDPELTRLVNDIIQRATAKDANQRYTDALTIAADFHRALAATRSPGLDEAHDAYFATKHVEPLDESLLVGETVNPYKGLRAFQEADAADFNGRESLTTYLIEIFRKARFLAVVGPSGSGKSSVVKAGMVPALRRGALPDSDKWYIVEMLPGAHPMEELEATLLRIAVNPPESLLTQLKEDKRGLARAVNRVLPSDGELLLVIDQFEEMFTLVEKEADRAHFLSSLSAAISESRSRLRVIVTLRADFYDRPLLYPEFGELIRQYTEVVLPLTAEELEHAIRRPAERVGLRIAPELVNEIVSDVRDQPGALPLLQYALTELFERRDGRRLTLEAYQAIGGTLGALTRRADQLYDDLDARGQEIVRQLFLRLVTLGEGAEDTRRRVLQSELLSIGGVALAGTGIVRDIIDDFGKYRLLTFDSDPATRTPTVEVAHEALIRRWGRLREWLLDSREDLRMQRALAAAAEDWLKAGKDQSFLLRGSRLEQMELWASETKLSLNQEETQFLRASIDERERLHQLEAARQAREEQLEQNSRRRLQALVAVLALATILALLLTAFAVSQSQVAQNNAGTATVAQGEALIQSNNAATAAAVAQLNAEEAQSLALASSAQLALSGGNTELALALAASAERFDLPLVQRALYETAYAPGVHRRMSNGHTGAILSAAYHPDGHRALTGAADHRVLLWDLDTGEMLRSFEGHTDWVRSVTFSPNGAQALSASVDGTLILWDIATGAIMRQMTGHSGAVNQALFLPDGAQAISASDDGTLIVWDLRTGTLVRQLQSADASPIKTVAVSPDGSQALSGDEASRVTLWDLRSGLATTTFVGHENTVYSAAFSPDGQTALSGSSDRVVILWDISTGRALRRFEGHSDWVWSVAFSPNGRFAISGSEDNKLILWNLSTGELVRRFDGHSDKVYAVAFSPDGRGVISGGNDNTLIQWDIDSGAAQHTFEGHSDWINSVTFSPNGERAITASSDGTLILWDLIAQQPLITLGVDGSGHSAPIWTVEFSPDGRYALSGSDDTTAILWDVDEASPTFGQVLRQYSGHADWVNDLTFSPDGRTFLTASGDTTLILWDVATGAAIRTFEGHMDAATSVDFSRDGRYAVSSSYDTSLILWEVETGNIVHRFGEAVAGHTARVNAVAFLPDDRYILSGADDATLILWDVETGDLVRRFREHTGGVFALAVSPDGRTALSASGDNTLIRWDIATGVAINRYEGHSEAAAAVAYSPNGHTLLSGSYDTTLMLWRIDSLDELFRWIDDNRYVRDLTCSERELYNLAPCGAFQAQATRTPRPTIAPSLTPSAAAAADLTQTTATPTATTTLTLTPLPTATPTAVPPVAQSGEQRGFIPLGDREAWRFAGQAGQVITISLRADRPANDFTLEEREARDLLDTLLVVRAPDGSVLAENDDVAQGITDSQIVSVTLPVDGEYIIEARSYGNEMDGPYTLVIEVVGTATPMP
jgi:WD40 repeat protein/serine/threonine protein kinase